MSLRDWLTAIVVLATLALFAAVIFVSHNEEAIALVVIAMALVVTAMARILGTFAGIQIKK